MAGVVVILGWVGWRHVLVALAISAATGVVPMLSAGSVAAPCAPRPSVQISVTSIGVGRLRVVIGATNSAELPNNALHALRFESGANALVDIDERVGERAEFVYMPQAGTA